MLPPSRVVHISGEEWLANTSIDMNLSSHGESSRSATDGRTDGRCPPPRLKYLGPSGRLDCLATAAGAGRNQQVLCSSVYYRESVNACRLFFRVLVFFITHVSPFCIIIIIVVIISIIISISSCCLPRA